MNKENLLPTYDEIIGELKAKIGDLEVQCAIFQATSKRKDNYIAELEGKLEQAKQEPSEEK